MSLKSPEAVAFRFVVVRCGVERGAGEIKERMQRVSPLLTAVCRVRISRQQLFERLLGGVCRAGRVGERRGRGLAQFAVLVSFRVPAQMQKMQVSRWYDSHVENCR